jgi:hypothetical protein
MEVSDQLYTGGKNTRFPLERMLGGPKSKTGCDGKDKNSQPLPEIEPQLSSPQPSHYTNWAILAPQKVTPVWPKCVTHKLNYKVYNKK